MGARAGVVRGSDLSTRSPALRVVLLLVLAGVWAAAAWWLWDSVVPGDLSLPDVRLDGIPQQILDRADRYERFFRVEFVVSQLVLLGVLILYAKYGVRFAKESAAGRIGTGMLLGMIGLALVWSSRRCRSGSPRCGGTAATTRPTAATSRRSSRTGSSSAPSSCSSASRSLVVMALAGRFPRRWWLAAAPFFVGLAALFSFIYPYLTPTEPLRRS